ncbi:hypothetical protein G3580_05420 [Nitrogeniibacter mangrovi]|uniref:Uncharacterized protein n=1 Tax=Nitrogeniibacter mangrovi TaxID=2016596 RepID=A0A6C1B4D6_9RHOO|nr:hypothetical protein [Nitrogeniibacter mangrovi]QID17130.1 hypothetical protein G3580_05420 [Nitrogeniibacter mangrovi]
MNTHKHIEHDEANQPTQAEAVTRNSRRRLIGGAGVGVLMAVSAKTALGTNICQSPSAMVSGNTSPNRDAPPPCSGGRSPGFWRNPQHFNAWVGATPPTLVNVAQCPTGLGGISPDNICTQGTTVDSVFGSAATSLLTSYSGVRKGNTIGCSAGPYTINPSDWGLWGVLAFPKDAGIQEGHLLWHLCAAYLNSLAFPDYALTTQQVVEAGVSLMTTGTWCPDSLSSSCGTNAFTPSSFVAYLDGMYDINADLNIQWCTSK